jgi:hypothetical protein
MYFNPLKPEGYLNYILKLNSYLQENTTRLNYKDKLVNAV